MWSAWLSAPGPKVSRKLPVRMISGWWRRITSASVRRSGTPYSTIPSGSPRNSTVVDADDPARLDLLGLADPAALLGLHPVDAGLAAGDHHVGDVLALAGPPGDGGGGAELHVVGVRDDRDRLRPVLGQGLQGLGVHGAEHGRYRVAGVTPVGKAAR